MISFANGILCSLYIYLIIRNSCSISTNKQTKNRKQKNTKKIKKLSIFVWFRTRFVHFSRYCDPKYYNFFHTTTTTTNITQMRHIRNKWSLKICRKKNPIEKKITKKLHTNIRKQSLKDRHHRCPIWIISWKNPAARQIPRTQHLQQLL